MPLEVKFEYEDKDIDLLRRALATMPERSATLLGNACLAALQPVEEAARASTRFRDRSGRLRASIVREKIRARFPLGDGQWITRQGAARVIAKEYYALFVERGKQNRGELRNRSFRSTRAEGRFFMQHALQSTRPQQSAAFIAYLRGRLARLARYGLT